MSSTPNGVKIPLIIDTAILIACAFGAIKLYGEIQVLGQSHRETKEAVAKQEEFSKEDHDTLVRLEAEQKNIKEDVEEIKGDVKEILRAVK